MVRCAFPAHDVAMPLTLQPISDEVADAILRMFADFVPVRTIAKKTGLTPAEIRALRGCDWTRIKLQEIFATRAAEYEHTVGAALAVVQSATLPAAQELVDQIQSPRPERRASAARQILDRGGVPKSKHLSTTIASAPVDLTGLVPPEMAEAISKALLESKK